MAASKSIYEDDDVIKFTELQKNDDLNLYYTKYEAKIYDYCVLSPESQFDKIYLVSGMRRSGNHLLLQTIFCSCPDNSILFINDFSIIDGD